MKSPENVRAAAAAVAAAATAAAPPAPRASSASVASLGNGGRALAWAGYAAALLLLPLVFGSEFAQSVSAKLGIAIIFALSYNMLLGQSGMLSFGHAIYSGLGGYFTIHVLASMNAGAVSIPVSLLPLVGGISGMLLAVLLGWVSTRRAGTTFAMISLGIGELVTASVLMIPAFFGGEAGIAANRVTGPVRMGIDFSSGLQMYYLIAAWALVCTAAMYYITRTPFGRLANAVRDNPERVAFVGYSTHLVRYQMMILAGLFAGISGGLAALNNEIVTIETVGAHASGLVLLMVFIGGMGHFAGPILGALVVTLIQSVLSTFTHAWLFYFGLLFLIIVLFAPQGLAGLLFRTTALRGPGAMRRALPALGMSLVAAVLLLGATGLGVESAYRLWGGGTRSALNLGFMQLDPAGPAPWLAAAALLALGMGAVQLARRAAVPAEAR